MICPWKQSNKKNEPFIIRFECYRSLRFDVDWHIRFADALLWQQHDRPYGIIFIYKYLYNVSVYLYQVSHSNCKSQMKKKKNSKNKIISASAHAIQVEHVHLYACHWRRRLRRRRRYIFHFNHSAFCHPAVTMAVNGLRAVLSSILVVKIQKKRRKIQMSVACRCVFYQFALCDAFSTYVMGRPAARHAM